MTRQEHYNIFKEHHKKAMDAVTNFINTNDRKYFSEYKEESKIANKHYGIARAMSTKETKKILESCLCY